MESFNALMSALIAELPFTTKPDSNLAPKNPLAWAMGPKLRGPGVSKTYRKASRWRKNSPQSSLY